MAKIANIRFEDQFFAGEDKTLKFTIVDENEDPANITGFQLEWRMKRKVSDTTSVVVKKSTLGEITITDGPNGVFEVDIDAGDTSPLDAGKFHHSARRTDSGFNAVFAAGEVEMKKAA